MILPVQTLHETVHFYGCNDFLELFKEILLFPCDHFDYVNELNH